MGESSTSEYKWMESDKINAKRKPDQQWESLKATILREYKTRTLEDVMRYMEENYGFSATKRQYVHRMEKWGIKKYNTKPGKTEQKTPPKRAQNTESIPKSSFELVHGHSQVIYDNQNIDPLLYEDMNSHESNNPLEFKYWYSLLGDIHYAIGDSQTAFQIRARLYQQYPDVSLAVACGQSAEVKTQISYVRVIIEKAINQPEVRDDSWIKFLFGAQLARTWDHEDQDNAFEQTALLVEKYLDDSTCQHRPMVTRGPELDILAYSHLRHLIRQYNKDNYNFPEGEKRLRVDKFLENFLEHQPWVSRRNIPCLRSCLDWCIETMEAYTASATGLQNIPKDPVYKIVCLLLWAWTQGLQGLPRVSPEWSEQATHQLFISAPELLTLVVCMIMATPITTVKPKGQQSDSTIADAIRRAKALRNMKSGNEALVQKFLLQVERIADQRMAASDDPVYLVRSSEFQPVRDFIATCVPAYIQLPRAHNGYIHPLTAADPVKEEPERQTPSPPVPSLIDFQHEGSYEGF